MMPLQHQILEIQCSHVIQCKQGESIQIALQEVVFLEYEEHFIKMKANISYFNMENWVCTCMCSVK